MNATRTLGLLTALSLFHMGWLSAPANAQRRVCIETDQGKRVCGRLIDGGDNNFNNNFGSGSGTRCDVPGFDEEFYLDAYSDVAIAIRQGRFKSACQHYQQNGRFEGRFPRFNEASYLAKNPDVAQAIKAGRYKNAYEHWLKFGRFENRPL
jgi:hypothetical protein